MFIGHLPAGYILTKKIQENAKVKRYLWLGLFGSIFPDLDVFYFYLVDGRQHLHHGYWTHLPFDWLVISLIVFLTIQVSGKKEYRVPAFIFLSNVFLHFILDTIVGKIEWLYPFSDKSYSLFEVPAVYNFWVYNFIFHWTFLFEVAVIVWAIYVYFKSSNKSAK